MNPQDTPNSIPNTPELSSGGEKWLSMSEAALHTPYSSEYLSLLARKGKLTAKKINDVWYTTKSILDEYMQRQMLREQVQNGNAPAPNVASAAPDARGNAPMQASSEISLQNLPTSTVLKPIRSYADDHQEYIARQSVSATIPKVTAASGVHASTIENIEHALERVLEKKLSRPEPMRRLSLSLPGVSSLGRGLLALMLTGIVLFTVMPVPFVFSFFEKSYDAVKGVIGDARTVMGFRPGTHANELLLLDKSGNVSIMGHLESHVTDGSAPIVVDSTTQVNNLNADYVNGLHASDFTLAYVTKNGNVTTEDVKLDGRVEVGKTLIVSGITNLNDVTVLGDAEFKQILKVLGPAYFADVVTAESDLNTRGNLKVSKNISVRGSVNAGGAVIGDSGTFSNVNVSDTISAVVGKFESLIASDISASALTSASSTLADVRITTLAADVSTLSKLTFGNATGTSATTTNFFATTASTTNLFAQVFTAGSLNSPGLNSFGNVLVNGSSTLQDFTFLHATGTSATTTTFFATTGSFTNLVGGTQTLSNLIFTLATGTSATTTNFFSSVASSTNLFSTNANLGLVTLGNATSTNLFSSVASSTSLFATSLNLGTGLIGLSTTTSATTTSLFATTASSTNLYSSNANFGSVILVLSTTTSATTTNFFATTASSTNLYAASLAAGSITGASILANSSTTLQNFTGLNSTTTNATSTAHFATTASSTNLFSANASLGVVNIATSTIASLNIGSATTSRLAINSLTAGSVPFIGAGGLVTQNNGQLFWDNSQTFLGIGITNPTQKLQVSGGIALFDSASVGAGANTTSGIRIVAPISSSHFNWMIGAQQNVNGGFEITPSTATGGTTFSTPSLTVLASNGNVGIGTTNPTTGRLAVLQGTNSSTGGVSVTNSGSGGALYAWTDASNIARIDSQSNASGNISLNGSGTGNVGIGTTTLAYQTEIYGAGQTTAALTDSGSTGGSLFLTTSDGSVGSGGALLFGARVATNNAPQAAIKLLLNNGPAQGTADLAFATRNATGDTALTERMRILSSGFVGIGTTNPTNPLEAIRAGSGFTSVAYFKDLSTNGNPLIQIGDAAQAISIGHVNTNPSAANYGFIAYTGLDPTAGQGIILKSTGNVGIGTTAPVSKLQVNGDLTLDSAGQHYYYEKNGAVPDTNWYSSLENSPSGAQINTTAALVNNVYGGAATYGYMLRNTLGTSLFEVQGSDGKAYLRGNVGIGVTNPVAGDGSAKVLQIGDRTVLESVVGVQSMLSRNAYYDGTWKRVVAGYATAIRMYDDPGDGSIAFHLGSSSSAGSTLSTWDSTDVKMVIRNGGNVGIGITNPSVKLQIQGTGSGLFGSSFYHIVTGSGTTGQGVLLGYTTETGVGGMIAGDATGGVVNNLIFGGYNGSAWGEKMRIRGDGNVGIGTTGPNTKLDVRDAGTAVPALGSEGTGFKLARTDGIAEMIAGYVSQNNGDFYIQTQRNDGATASNLLLNPRGGNVGIGTTNPTYPLTMSNSSETGIRTVVGANDIYISHGGWGMGTGKLGIGNGSVPTLVVHSTLNGASSVGGVGIGTTAPSGRLQVVGGYINITDAETSAGTYRLGAVNGLVGTYSAGLTAIRADGGIRFAGQARDISAGADMVIDTSGRVGIGITAPLHPLQVYGTLKVGGAANQQTGVIALGDDTSTGTYNGLYRGNIATLGSANWLNVGGYDGVNITTGNALFGSQTSRITAVNSTGFVGIGITSPNAKLDVNGAAAGSGMNIHTTGDIVVGGSGSIFFNDLYSYATGATIGTYDQVNGNTAGLLKLVNHNIVGLVVNTSGQVGIGRTNPTVSFQVSGHAIFDNNVDISGSLFVSGGCSGCVDLAEKYAVSEDVTPGDVVAIDEASGNSAVLKKAGPTDQVVGIVSTSPGLTLGGGITVGGGTTSPDTIYSAGGEAPIALTGRVPVSYSEENGVIKNGDYLMLSSTEPGKAAKAVKAGIIIGQALEDAALGKVLVFVEHFYYDPTAVDLATLTHKVDAMDVRLTALESLMASSTALTVSTSTPNFIASVLDVMKADIVDGVTHLVQLAVDSLSTYALTVGKSATIGTTEKPIGITVYDEDTGAPFCMKVKSGMQVSTAGPCGSEPLNIQPLPTSGGSPNPSQGDTSASSTPSVDSSASSTPPVMQEAIAPDTSEPPPADASSTDSGTISTP